MLNSRLRSSNANITYIRAALFERFGIMLSHHQIFELLLQEKLIVRSDIKIMSVPDLNQFGSSFEPSEKIYQSSPPSVDRAINLTNKGINIDRH